MRLRSDWCVPLAAIAIAGLLACGGGEAGGSGEMEAEGQAAEDTAAEMQGMQEEAADSVQVSLAPKNQSGIEGTATIRHRGDTVHVSVSLSGLESGNSYPAHIHQGTCQEGGGVAAGLTAVEASDGTGTSETRIPAAKLDMEARHFVQAHLPDGTPAACGDLPSHEAATSESGMDTASSGSGSGSG